MQATLTKVENGFEVKITTESIGTTDVFTDLASAVAFISAQFTPPADAGQSSEAVSDTSTQTASE